SQAWLPRPCTAASRIRVPGATAPRALRRARVEAGPALASPAANGVGEPWPTDRPGAAVRKSLRKAARSGSPGEPSASTPPEGEPGPRRLPLPPTGSVRRFAHSVLKTPPKPRTIDIRAAPNEEPRRN